MDELQRTFEQARKLYQERYGSTEALLRSAGIDSQRRSEIEVFKALSQADRLRYSTELPLSVDREVKRLRESFETSSSLNAFTALDSEVQRTRDLLRSTRLETALPTVLMGYTAWEGMIRELRRQALDSEYLMRTPRLADRFVASAERFGAFLYETTEQLARTDDPALEMALEGSIVLAEDVISTNVVVTSDFDIDDAGDTSDVAAAEEPALVLPFVQRSELVLARHELASIDVPALAPYSAAFRSAQHVHSAIGFLSEVNTARKMKDKKETFKPTTRFAVAIRDVLFIVPMDERTFGDFMDALYFLLFESAGDEHPRFLIENEGELERDECEVVWMVKRLRNFFRHDPDHGKNSDMRKKFTSLNEDMATFGLRSLPRTAEEYRRVHNTLLRQTADFLRLLRDRV